MSALSKINFALVPEHVNLEARVDTLEASSVGAGTSATTLGGYSLAAILDRASHTGTQTISTVTGLQAALDARTQLSNIPAQSLLGRFTPGRPGPAQVISLGEGLEITSLGVLNVTVGGGGTGLTSFETNFSVKQKLAGVGTVSNAANSQIVTGVGTTFLTTFRAGDTIIIGSDTKTILSIASNLELTTTTAISAANTTAAYTTGNAERFRVEGNGKTSVFGDFNSTRQISAATSLFSPSSVEVGAKVQLAASQTANAIEVLASGNAVPIFKISSAGAVTATSIAASGSITAASYSGITGNQVSAPISDAGKDVETSKYLRWKYFGSGFVIIDASQATSPSGTTVSRTNSAVPWETYFPMLVGWNGANTFGVRVDSARVADNGGVTSVADKTGVVVLTKTDVGLGLVPNLDATNPVTIVQTASYRFATDAEKATWNGKQNALGFTPENAANKGTNNGYAGLDGSGLIPTQYLPSYVDDVLEFANFAALPAAASAATGKIYVTLDNNLTYRWSGSAYIEISASLALGTTSATAFRGDWGNIAYNHSLITTGNPHGSTTSDITEGSRLYYTDARFDARFNTQFAAKTTTNLTEGANLYYTDARFDTRFGAKSTTNLAEGTNLYFTNARVDARIASNGVSSVNARTGAVVLTKTDVGLSAVVNSDTSTTANITDSVNKRFVTDANLTTIGNQTGTNTGNVTLGTANGLSLSGQILSLSGIPIAAINGLGTAATKDFPASGNATAAQVVLGSDTRLGASTITVGTTVFNAATQGSVFFAGSGGVLSQNNANLFWDNGNSRLGIGTNAPAAEFHLVKGVSDFRFFQGLDNQNPTISIVNTSAGGKATALLAGAGGSAFIYDVAGSFAIVSDTKANFTSNNLGNGTLRLLINESGNASFSGAVTASNLSGTNRGDQDLSNYVTVSGAPQTIAGLKTFTGGGISLGRYNNNTTANAVRYIGTVGQSDTFEFGNAGIGIVNSANGFSQGVGFYTHLANVESAQRAFITPSGNFLIGKPGEITDDGTNKLQVSGTARFTGDVTSVYRAYDATTWNGSNKLATWGGVHSAISTASTPGTSVYISQIAPSGVLAQANIDTLGTSAQKELIVNAVTQVNANVTIPPNIYVSYEGAGIWQVAAGINLTIRWMQDAGNRLLFTNVAGQAVGNVVFGANAVPAFRLAWWTGNATGGTYTTALANIISSMHTNLGGVCYFPGGDFTFTQSYNPPSSSVFKGSGCTVGGFYAAPSGGGTVLRFTTGNSQLFYVGSLTANTPNNQRSVRFQDLSITCSGAALNTSVGLLVSGGGSPQQNIYGVECRNVAFNGGIYNVNVGMTANGQVENVNFDHCYFIGGDEACFRLQTRNGTTNFIQPYFSAKAGKDCVRIHDCGLFTMSNAHAVGPGTTATTRARAFIYFAYDTTTVRNGITGTGIDKANVTLIGCQDENVKYSILTEAVQPDYPTTLIGNTFQGICKILGVHHFDCTGNNFIARAWRDGLHPVVKDPATGAPFKADGRVSISSDTFTSDYLNEQDWTLSLGVTPRGQAEEFTQFSQITFQNDSQQNAIYTRVQARFFQTNPKKWIGFEPHKTGQVQIVSDEPNRAALQIGNAVINPDSAGQHNNRTETITASYNFFRAANSDWAQQGYLGIFSSQTGAGNSIFRGIETNGTWKGNGLNITADAANGFGGNATIAGTLGVTGTSTLASLNVTGHTSTASLGVTNDQTISGKLQIGTNIGGAKLNIFAPSTVEPQFQVGYNEGSYFRVSVPVTTGIVSFEAIGTAPAFNFANKINGFAVINSNVGFQIGGTAPAGQFLRGTGTNFVSSQIQASDLGTAFANTALTGTTTAQNLSITQNLGTITVYNSSTAAQLRLGASSSFCYDLGRNSAPQDPATGNINGYFQIYGSQSNATGFVFTGVDGERFRIAFDGSVSIKNLGYVGGQARQMVTVNSAGLLSKEDVPTASTSSGVTSVSGTGGIIHNQTTGAISLSLGAITPTSVASSGLVSALSQTEVQLRIGHPSFFYDIGRNASTGFLDFTGSQIAARGFTFNGGVSVLAGTSGLYAKVGGSLYDHLNTRESAVDDATIYNAFIPANTLAKNGDKLIGFYSGVLSPDTNPKTFRFFFQGILICEPRIVVADSSFEITVSLMRVLFNFVRISVNVTSSNTSQTFFAEKVVADLSGNASDFQLNGYSALASGFSARMGWVKFQPAANN